MTITCKGIVGLIVLTFVCMGCGGGGSDDGNDGIVNGGGEGDIILLHHSTGGNIWNGGVWDWFAQNAPQYQIVEQWFPANRDNYPFDYIEVWVNQTDASELRLETLTQQYQMIIFKHCFPVSEIEEDIGAPDVSSGDRRLENYYVQYAALKNKLDQFPNTLFLVWTGAALTRNTSNDAWATRARTFFNWVKNTWDVRGDHIYIWDFYELETEGGLYMLDAYAESPDDSHPNGTFAQTVAPLFAQRIVNVFEGRGDSTSLTGR